MDWAKDLDVPLAAPGDDREVLLWVGCAGAFDPRAQSTVRALAQLLQKAGVRFTVLGPKERCTGDPARRMGDEFLYQQLAQTNIDTFAQHNVTTIVTQCPHCFHTIKNEYPQLGGNFEVFHHTQFLEKLMAEGRLNVPSGFAESVTYHDPCFLARVNHEHQAPRSLFKSVLQIPLKEPDRRNDKTFCCGAGGGRMWMEEEPDKRPGVNRAKELLATGAQTVATGCPFCRIMVGDTVAQVSGDSAPPVRDIAEIVLESIQASGDLPLSAQHADTAAG
jgi:Fe-S oxidoreductase